MMTYSGCEIIALGTRIRVPVGSLCSRIPLRGIRCGWDEDRLGSMHHGAVATGVGSDPTESPVRALCGRAHEWGDWGVVRAHDSFSQGGDMPSQMRRGMTGTPTAGKAGTRVMKWKMPAGRFGPMRQGIMAHGE